MSRLKWDDRCEEIRLNIRVEVFIFFKCFKNVRVIEWEWSELDKCKGVVEKWNGKADRKSWVQYLFF